MKLRFAVNQGEALRKGIDSPSSKATIDIDPADLSQEQRQLLADRMWPGSIEVFCLRWDKFGKEVTRGRAAFDLIMADSPDLDGLLEAVSHNQAAVEAAMKEAK